MPHYGDYQNAIYLAGLSGVVPKVPVDFATLESRAAADTGISLCASTLSNDPLEAVRQAMGDTPGFFQLYTPRNRDLAASLVARAEAVATRPSS